MKSRIQLLVIFIGAILLSACNDDPWYFVPEYRPTIETPYFLEPTNTEIQTEIPTEEPTVEVSENLCNNPYWPISEGAYWVYDSYNYISTRKVKFSINNIVSTTDVTTFELIGESGGIIQSYHCTHDGIFDSHGHYMLPFTQEFQDGMVYESNGHQTEKIRLEQINVPAGTFDVVTVCWEDFYVWCFSYSLGIGPVRGNFQAMDIVDSLVSYNLPTSPTLEQPTSEEQPTPSFEAQVRYILADSHLLGDITYYREFLDQPAVDEAVRRWDSGVRVTNIGQFERKKLGEKGWKVVYKGTETIIDGIDVILTTDEISENLCNNSYWPITLHASWGYKTRIRDSQGEVINQSQEDWSITKIDSAIPENLRFTISVAKSGSLPYNVNYFCDESGIYKEDGSSWRLVLPAESEIIAGQRVGNASTYGELLIVGFVEIATVPTGIITCIEIVPLGSGEEHYYYSPKIGLIAWWWSDKVDSLTAGGGELVEFFIPGKR